MWGTLPFVVAEKPSDRVLSIDQFRGLLEDTPVVWPHAVQDPVHVHDLHATMLHVLGIDHEMLSYRYSGRDYQLTDI